MAYGTKYSLAYDAIESPSRDLATYLLTFELDGYSGSIIPLRYGGESPVVAKIKNNQDSAIGIKEKQLNIEILEDIDLSELQRAKPKQWKVTHYKTVDSTTTTDFQGWLVPTNSGTPYEDGDKYIRLEANDGIGFLKNIDFVDDAGKYYEGLTSIFEIVRLCLSKTGLSLKLNTINNTYAVGNAQNDADDALKQRFLDIDLYRGDKEPLDTYKVLEQILLSEKCRISQEDGEWWFENTTEKTTGYVKARKYQPNGTFISGGTLDLRVAALHDSNFHPMGGGEVSSIPANKWVKVVHKLAGYKNRILNRDFANFFVDDFIDWTKTVSPAPTLSRVGDGTTSNPYGAKFSGFNTKNKDTGYIYQTILLASASEGNLQQALNTNIIFRGDAYTQDVDHALVSLRLTIKTSAFTYNGSTAIPATTTIHDLNDSGEWESQTFIELENKDINNYSKKTAKSWDITSKRIGDVSIPYGKSGMLGPSAWNPYVTEVSVSIRLHTGVGELDAAPGETQSCAVWYKNLSLSFVNTDTNRNLREISYKATQQDYAPNNDTIEVQYGDYVDSSNLSALKYADGSLTKLWTSESDNSPKNFHTLGVVDVLDETGGNPKVYDGTIWGLLKFRHSVELAGFTNRGYVVGYTYDYAKSMADVRIIEHQDTQNMTVKKTGVLSDGTEIDMPDDSPPSAIMGNGVGGGSTGGGGGMTPTGWLQQVLSGIQGYTVDEEPVNVVWGNVVEEDAFDLGAIVRRDDKLLIGKDDDNIELGNAENDTLVKVLGRLGVADNVFYDKSFTNDDGSVLPMLGLDTYELFLHGDLELGGKLSLQSGVVEIGTRDYDDNLQAAYLSSPNNRLILESSQGIETAGDLFVSKIAGIGSAAVLADSNWQFLQPVLGVDSANAASFVTRYYVDTLFAASAFGDIRIYPAVKAASNGTNITLSGLQTIDGVSLSADEKVLLKDQTNPAENYIWIVKSGAWERVSDLPNDSIKGVQVQVVDGGLVNKGGIFVNTNSEDEIDIILSTTAITFVQSFQNIGNPYMASLAANDQIFYGTNKFIEKLEVRTPLSNTEAANKSYVDLQDNALANTMTTGFWGKISNFGIGTTTNNGLNFYSNNVKRAELNTGGRLSGLAGININDTVFTPAFSTSGFGSYYGLTSNKGIYVGSLGGTTQNLYSADFVRGGNSGARAGLRFGSYNSGGGIANFYYGIEYSTAEKLTIGRYSSSGMDGESTAFDSSKLIVFDSSGNVSFGKSVAEYRVDVNGDINVSGMFRINGSFGADHRFLKSNGTTQEFAEINCGEISDIADLYLSIEDAESTYLSIVNAEANYALKQDAVLYATFDNERGIPFYSDVEKTTLEAQISVNADAGIALGMYGYKFIDEDTSSPVQFGLQLNRTDGKLYHYTLEGTQERILTTADDLGGAGSWVGGTVSTSLNFEFSKEERFLANNGELVHRQFSSWDGANTFSQLTAGTHIISATNSIYLNVGVSGLVYIDNVGLDMSDVPALVNQFARFYITSVESGKYIAKIVAE